MSAASSSPRTGQLTVPVDPARRPDVLLRRRLPEGHRVSPWWMIGSFVAVYGVQNAVNMIDGALARSA